jgi:hypothetical protein
MQKIIVSLCMAGLLSVSASAQQSPGKKKLDWGLKTGINVSTLHGNGTMELNPSWKSGFVFGAFFRINKLKNITIQPEVLYSSMGGHVQQDFYTRTSYRVNYISIPVLARFALCKNNAKWFAVAGPQVDALVYAKQVTSNEGATVTDSFKEFGFNAVAGFEWWPNKEFGFSARYLYGFSDITRATGDIKNMGAQATFAVKL